MAQPEGLVVTATALKAVEANITSPVTELQATLHDLAGEKKRVTDLRTFFRDILGWSGEFLVAREEIPPSLRVSLDGGEHLCPDYAVRSAEQSDSFILLIGEAEPAGAGLDQAADDKRWSATPHQRFERLLRETAVHIGLLTNGKVFRLVYAPKGESAGWVDFRVADMLDVDGRMLLGAMHMLLNERRLLSLEPAARLSGLLQASREYQNTVSNALREQVLAALRELLLGFQRADGLAHGAILGDYRGEHLQEVYRGLTTVLMRMVFVLFAEERVVASRFLLPMESELYANSYSLTRLYAQLAADYDRHGDTLNDRYGAWARIIALFRLLHDGKRAAGGFHLPARSGDFFSPNAFPFLEGRRRGSQRQRGELLDLPKISDGVIFNILKLLLVLRGERLQYKGLDVEQIGSVYEGLMGYKVEVAAGDSLCLTPEHVVVDLNALLKLAGPDRLKQLKLEAGLDLKDKAATEFKAATTVAALQTALSRRISSRQPGLITRGSLFLQPGEERRRTGSHYTPRSLTQPIVETTLRPVLERLGPDVTPEQLLELKICDPAMGSGAFLVGACRHLADLLVAAWRRTGTMPPLPLDEDPLLHAKRLVAQRCIYGVDKNPLAVDLARLSLWLETFAREHPFTFVDHSLRCGDSLVGLTREQISSFTLDISKGKTIDTIRALVSERVQEAEKLRKQIHAIGDPPDTAELRDLWDRTNHALDVVRLLGDLVLVSYFSAENDKSRKRALDELRDSKVPTWLATGAYEAELRGMVADLKEGERPVSPFHWEIEFPEVFGRKNPGFDCFVGNPPYAGIVTASVGTQSSYSELLRSRTLNAGGKCDIVAFFFRDSFERISMGGTIGFVTTKTISQGDTRRSGLYYILTHGGQIYWAQRRIPWVGKASVVVSVIGIEKGCHVKKCWLDGKAVDAISAFLLPNDLSADPLKLHNPGRKAFVGCKPGSKGFIFADTSSEANPLATMEKINSRAPRSKEVIFPYLGGQELNSHPSVPYSRWIINLGIIEFDEAQRTYPEVMDLLNDKVKPYVDSKRWWLFARSANELHRLVAENGLRQVLVIAEVSDTFAFSFVSREFVLSNKIVAVTTDKWKDFCLLQSRVHEIWARTFSSTMKNDLTYVPADCFETFPFPDNYEQNPSLEAVGKQYYEFRAALMLKNNEGLTKTYNRFHDRDEDSEDIRKLRELHAQMDRAVLEAYGWQDIQPVYDFRPQLDESIRLTWSEETRDEVLARLLERNRLLAEKEKQESEAEAKPAGTKKAAAKKRAAKTDAAPAALTLPGFEDPGSRKS